MPIGNAVPVVTMPNVAMPNVPVVTMPNVCMSNVPVVTMPSVSMPNVALAMSTALLSMRIPAVLTPTQLSMDHHAGQHHCYIVPGMVMPNIVASMPRGLPCMAVPHMVEDMVMSTEGVRWARLDHTRIVSMSIPSMAVPSMAVPSMFIVPMAGMHPSTIVSMSMSVSATAVSDVPWGVWRLSWGPSIAVIAAAGTPTWRVVTVHYAQLLVNLQVVFRRDFVERWTTCNVER